MKIVADLFGELLQLWYNDCFKTHKLYAVETILVVLLSIRYPDLHFEKRSTGHGWLWHLMGVNQMAYNTTLLWCGVEVDFTYSLLLEIPNAMQKVWHVFCLRFCITWMFSNRSNRFFLKNRLLVLFMNSGQPLKSLYSFQTKKMTWIYYFLFFSRKQVDKWPNKCVKRFLQSRLFHSNDYSQKRHVHVTWDGQYLRHPWT